MDQGQIDPRSVASTMDPSQSEYRPFDPSASANPGLPMTCSPCPGLPLAAEPGMPTFPYQAFPGQVMGQGQCFMGSQVVQGQILQPVMGMSRPQHSDLMSEVQADCLEEFVQEHSMQVPGGVGQRMMADATSALSSQNPAPPFLPVPGQLSQGHLSQIQGQILGQSLGQDEGQLVYVQPPSGVIQQSQTLKPQFVQGPSAGLARPVSPVSGACPQQSVSPNSFLFGGVQPGVVTLEGLGGGGTLRQGAAQPPLQPGGNDMTHTQLQQVPAPPMARFQLGQGQGYPPLTQVHPHHHQLGQGPGHCSGGHQLMEAAGRQCFVGGGRDSDINESASKHPQYYPGWIKEQLYSTQHPGFPMALNPPSAAPPCTLPPVTLHSIGVRPYFLSHDTAGGSWRAQPVKARFRALYPMGYPRAQGPMGHPAGSKAADEVNVSPAGLMMVPSHASDHFANGIAGSVGFAGEVPMEVDSAASDYSVAGEQMHKEVAAAQRPEVKSLLDLHIQSAEGMRSVRDMVTRFIQWTYSQFGAATYCVPRKTPVNQHHPDKALVRTREGEFRVNLALEQLSLQEEEGMFILGDYHYENFFYHLNSAMVDSPSQQYVADTLTQLRRDKQFGDFDFLIFHPTCGIFSVGLCSVNSNSDVQYILKRVQKARVQLDKSATVAQRCIATLGINCSVTRVFCTPNLKRSFLTKVIARDKVTDRALSSLFVLCSDQLPGQFRTKWYSSKMFHGLVDWWNKVKAECHKTGGQLNQVQLTEIVGSFLCPMLSKVDFDQTTPLQPSQKQEVVMDSQDTLQSGLSQGRESSPSPTSSLDLSSLNLTIGNVNKPFSSFMKEFVDLYYPDLLEKTYRVPPVHFNIQKMNRQEGYDLLEMPMSKDSRGDEGENRVVSAIEMLGMSHKEVKPVFIICDFQYNNYLNKLKETMFVKGDDRRPRRAYGQSVRAQHDCLLIHRRYGIIIISVKAVGDNFEEWANSGNEQWGAVKRTLGKVLKQLPREEKMVDMVLGDLTSDLPCKKLIALPNLNRADIDTAIADDLQLKQDINDMFPGLGTQALLCKDELCDAKINIWDQVEENANFLPNLCQWWDTVVGSGRPNVLSKDLYKQIVGRFCGLLSTVEVWSMQTPRVEIRSVGEAVQETAHRYAKILLTQDQLAVLHQSPKYLFLWGPPGTGKTLMLTLAAQRWMAEGGHVVILNINYGSVGLPLGHALQRQVANMARHPGNMPHPGNVPHSQKSDSKEGSSSPLSVSPSHSPTPSPSLLHKVQRIDCDSQSFNAEEPGALADIPKNSFIIADEVMVSSHKITDWVVQHCQPHALWCAGQFQAFCPPEFESRVLNRILRCTPMVQRVLRHIGKELGSVGTELGEEAGNTRQQLQSISHNYVTSSAPWGLPTDGSRPWFIFHKEHNSPSSLPQGCQDCARVLAGMFHRDLHLPHTATSDHTKKGKQPPVLVRATGTDSLSLKDVVIVSREVESCEFSAMLKKCGVSVVVVTDTASRQVALPEQEHVVFTTPFAMAGLERKVVVYVASQSQDPLQEGDKEVEKGDDLKVGHALDQLTSEDRVSLWYTASRCLSQLIIIVP